MHGNLEVREIALQSLDDRHVAAVGNFVLAVRTAREQETVQPLRGHEMAHLLVKHLRAGCGNHRLENLLLAMVAVEAAFAGRDRKCREAVLAAALEFAAFVLLERRGRKTDGARHDSIAVTLELGQERRVELGVLEILDILHCLQPAHSPVPLCSDEQ